MQLYKKNKTFHLKNFHLTSPCCFKIFYWNKLSQGRNTVHQCHLTVATFDSSLRILLPNMTVLQRTTSYLGEQTLHFFPNIIRNESFRADITRRSALIEINKTGQVCLQIAHNIWATMESTASLEFVLLCVFVGCSASPSQPNIIFIVADDLGKKCALSYDIQAL